MESHLQYFGPYFRFSIAFSCICIYRKDQYEHSLPGGAEGLPFECLCIEAFFLFLFRFCIFSQSGCIGSSCLCFHIFPIRSYPMFVHLESEVLWLFGAILVPFFVKLRDSTVHCWQSVRREEYRRLLNNRQRLVSSRGRQVIIGCGVDFRGAGSRRRVSTFDCQGSLSEVGVQSLSALSD